MNFLVRCGRDNQQFSFQFLYFYVIFYSRYSTHIIRFTNLYHHYINIYHTQFFFDVIHNQLHRYLTMVYNIQHNMSVCMFTEQADTDLLKRTGNDLGLQEQTNVSTIIFRRNRQNHYGQTIEKRGSAVLENQKYQ